MPLEVEDRRLSRGQNCSSYPNLDNRFCEPGVMKILRTIRRKVFPEGRLTAVSTDDVRNCYRYILGREPENEEVVIEALTHHKNFHVLRESFLASPEFRDQYKALNHSFIEQPFTSHTRRTVVFIHLLKTAGSTLHSLLERHFAPDRIWPVRYNHIHRYTPAELSRFDFFSGHFDWMSTEFIPREHIERVAIFRKPQARLISFYRFVKSHIPSRDNENYFFVRLAHELSAEEFFEHSMVRATPEICNHYLLVFGLAYARVNLGWPPEKGSITAAILERAKQRIRSLDGIGISERFKESVDMVFGSLDLPVPESVENLQVTDQLPHMDSRYLPVPPVVITDRLVEALRDLTVYDDVIYSEALGEFERRQKMQILKPSIRVSGTSITSRRDAAHSFDKQGA